MNINTIEEKIKKFADYHPDLIELDFLENRNNNIGYTYTEKYWIKSFISDLNLACKYESSEINIDKEDILYLYNLWFRVMLKSLRDCCKRNNLSMKIKDRNIIYIEKK